MHSGALFAQRRLLTSPSRGPSQPTSGFFLVSGYSKTSRPLPKRRFFSCFSALSSVARVSAACGMAGARMIEVLELCKSYGAQRAVQGLSFHVGKGEVVGFLGPNGAGKSTTLRIIAGFLGASSGHVSVAGHDVAQEPLLARARLGYMPENCPLYPEMRVREYLRFRAAIKRVPAKRSSHAVSRALALAGIAARSERIIGHLSKGYRQRLGLADALVADPDLLILDEPTAGLDPNQIREVRRLIRELSVDHTVLLSTHILAEVEAACDRALVIADGKLVAAGTVEELRGAGSESVEIVVSHAERAPADLDSAIVERTTLPEGLERWRVLLGQRTTEEWVTELCARGVGIRQVQPTKHSLEEVFAQLTEAPRSDSEAS